RARARRADLPGDSGDEAVREAGRAAGVVALRQVVHQRRELQAVRVRVLAADRVHQAVAHAEQRAVLRPGAVRDLLDDGTRVALGAGERLARRPGARAPRVVGG